MQNKYKLLAPNIVHFDTTFSNLSSIFLRCSIFGQRLMLPTWLFPQVHSHFVFQYQLSSYYISVSFSVLPSCPQSFPPRFFHHGVKRSCVSLVSWVLSKLITEPCFFNWHFQQRLQTQQLHGKQRFHIKDMWWCFESSGWWLMQNDHTTRGRFKSRLLISLINGAIDREIITYSFICIIIMKLLIHSFCF